jgi:predicted XRE-type DNA-binding protein
MSRIEKSSGDVFQDLGFSPTESEDLRLRSDLLIELQDRIGALKVSQSRIAERLGIAQPRVSDLLRGKIEKFSLDTLALFLRKLGAEVSFVVQPEDDISRLVRELQHGTIQSEGPAWTRLHDEWEHLSVPASLGETVSEADLPCDTALMAA